MIQVSDAWKDIQQRFLLSESYVEIDCTITEVGAQERASVSGTDEAKFSDVTSVLGLSSRSTPTKYATNELNLWALDGSHTILPISAPYGDVGYVSDIASTGSVTLTFPEVRTVTVPGVTITWSDKYGEYPRVFSVVAKNGDTVVAETTITDNTNRTSTVFLEMRDYNSITITVYDWMLPYRRTRIEKVVVGHVLTLGKKDILSYTHEQYGDLLSGEIPKNSIEFTLDNIDGRWNPNNPVGMEQYLSERQKLTVRYGLDVNGTIEWIKAGTFYLSEWDAPSNGLEARFVARDSFEFLLGVEMWSATYNSLSGMVANAVRYLIPDGTAVVYDSALPNYSLEYSPSYSDNVVDTAAEQVQKCANAAGAILRYDRDGVLHVEKLNRELSEYMIPLSLSYSYPQITLSKPLKEVDIDYGGESSYVLRDIATEGERQTLTNNYIKDAENAAVVAEWVASVLKNRKTVSGEFRADPRLDLFDVVTVESKYGNLTPVVITNIKYTFNGSFHGSYTGRILEGA